MTSMAYAVLAGFMLQVLALGVAGFPFKTYLTDVDT
jgi:hypothetical protein